MDETSCCGGVFGLVVLALVYWFFFAPTELDKSMEKALEYNYAVEVDGEIKYIEDVKEEIKNNKIRIQAIEKKLEGK